MSDNSSFVVVHIFPFAFIEGEVPVFFIVVYFQVTDGERGCFQNVIAHTEEKLRGKCPFIQPNFLNGYLIITYTNINTVIRNIHFEYNGNPFRM